MKLGIIGAMHQEVDRLIELMHCEKQTVLGMRTFYEGNLFGMQVVLVFSRWGKVAAATTATQLIVSFGVDVVLFTGIAGGLSHNITIGDVVIGDKLFQHDMDASPLMPRFEIPLSKKSYFETSVDLKEKAYIAVRSFLSNETAFLAQLQDFGIKHPKVWVGDIASGDQFIHTQAQRQAIITNLPSVLCVEMEGAAVAQVCYDYAIPFLVIRVISDTADDASVVDFPVFLEQLASKYAFFILKNVFSLLH